MGDREGGNLSPAGEVNPAETETTPESEVKAETPAAMTDTSDAETAEADERPQTVQEQAAQEIKVKDEEAVQEKPRGQNFVIPEKGLSLPSGEKARYKANIQAIKTLRSLMPCHARRAGDPFKIRRMGRPRKRF